MIVIHADGCYQPVCEGCGIALCWGLSVYEYEDRKTYWDNWRCEKCNPNYLREYARKINEENK